MSIDLINNSDFAIFGFEHKLIGGEPYYIVIAKQSYSVTKEGKLVKQVNKKDIRFEDVIQQSNIVSSSVEEPSDLIPYKPYAEIILNGTAKSTQPKTFWSTQLKLKGLKNDTASNENSVVWGKEVWVTGPRQWYRNTLNEWKLTEFTPTTQVSLSYENAYGGSLIVPSNSTIKDANSESPSLFSYDWNPSGTGWLPNDKYIERFIDKNPKVFGDLQRKSLAELLKVKNSVKAPQLYSKTDKSVFSDLTKPYNEIPVAGYSSFPSFWQVRMDKVENITDWLSEESGDGYPLSFDQSYWQQAPEDQWLPYPPLGGEKLEIIGIFPEGHQTYILPKNLVFLRVDDTVSLPIKLSMSIDTLIIDADTRTLEVVWRYPINLDNYDYDESKNLKVLFFAFDLTENVAL